MKTLPFSKALRHVATLVSIIAMLTAVQTVFAQKGRAPKHSTIVSAPSYSCKTDFSGDRQNDIVFFDQVTATWVMYEGYDINSEVEFGTREDLPLAADYDGDDIVDIAVVHSEDGLLSWQVLHSSTGTSTLSEWGVSDDVPVKGDFDGDGLSDKSVWRRAEGIWYILASGTGELMTITHGVSSDTAMPGDYDGDGRTDAAVFRLEDHSLHFLGSLDSIVHTEYWDSTFMKGNEFTPADYDGDSKTDFAIFNFNSGVWTVHQSSDGMYRTEIFEVHPSICIPLDNSPCRQHDFAFPSDYDNDGKADPAVWNSSTGEVYAVGSLSGGMRFSTLKSDTEMPVSAYFVTK